MAIHIAYIKQVLVDGVGNVINKNRATISDVASSSTRIVVVGDETYAPLANGTQTIEEYLFAEDAAGFELKHLSNTMIVTQEPIP